MIYAFLAELIVIVAILFFYIASPASLGVMIALAMFAIFTTALTAIIWLGMQYR